MKSFILTVLLHLIACCTLVAQSSASVSGQILHAEATQVYVAREHPLTSEPQLLDSARLDAEGRFRMTFLWEQTAPALLLYDEAEISLYLSPGQVAQVSFDAEAVDRTLRFAGSGAAENKYLYLRQLKHKLLTPRKHLVAALPPAAFVRFTDSVRQVQAQELAGYFGKEVPPGFRDALQYEYALELLDYPALHQAVTKAAKPVPLPPGYYDFLRQIPVQNPAAFALPVYHDYLARYLSFQVNKLYQIDSTLKRQYGPALQYETAARYFTGFDRTFLLSLTVYEALAAGKQFEQAALLYRRLKQEQGIPTDWHKLLDKAYVTAFRLQPGQPVPLAMAYDTQGQPVKLTDFAGKVVYVDVWASWCAPCIAELPHARQLQEAFKDSAVVFVNISLDATEAEWRSALQKHQVPGLNLYAPENAAAALRRAYHISGIPLYILIDEKGRLVSADAPRPSSGARAAIEAVLAEE